MKRWIQNKKIWIALCFFLLIYIAFLFVIFRFESGEIVKVDAEICYHITPFGGSLSMRGPFESIYGYKRIWLNEDETNYYVAFVKEDDFCELGFDQPETNFRNQHTFRVQFTANRLLFGGIAPVDEIEIEKINQRIKEYL